MPIAVPRDLLRETGHPGGIQPAFHPVLGSGYQAHSYEDNHELVFPVAQAVFDRMRRTDGQIQSMARAITQSLLKNPNRLNRDGVRDEVVKLVETELGLMAAEAGKRGRSPRRRRGVVWSEHKRDALLSIFLGFMACEKVWDVSPPAVDQDGIVEPGEDIVHLAKLGVRLPRTIQEIRVNRDGSLEGIIQAGIGWDTAGRGNGFRVIGGGGHHTEDATEVWIPARELVMYSFEREGGDWTGSSILRSAYKHWLIKDDLIRTDAIAANRNGMGIPGVYYDAEAGGTEHEARTIAENLRSGAFAGFAAPDKKYRVEIMGVTGQVRDALPSIKYHDQAMSRSAMAMFLDLGHDAGARSLGDTFVDQFRDALQAIDDWVCETATEHIIRDLVELNFGPDEPYPVLVADRIDAEGTITTEGLKMLEEAGFLHPTHDDEVELRRRYDLPAMPEVTVIGTPGEDHTPEAIIEIVPPQPGHPPDGVQDPLLAKAAVLVDRLSALRAAGHV